MVTFEELRRAGDPIRGDDVKKTEEFLRKINKFRDKCGLPMVPTSYLRSSDRQIRIYREKAANREFPFTDGVFDLKKVPMSSKHLHCEACDFRDYDGRLAKWVMDNLEWCRKNGFYFENPEFTKGWLHIQITPPKSGKTIFNP